MTDTKAKYRKKDLISLVWSPNTCYCDLISGVVTGVTVDTVAGTWTFKGGVQPIGSRRNPCMDITGDPIGVYDRTKTENLRTMKDDIEWVATRNRPTLDHDG